MSNQGQPGSSAISQRAALWYYIALVLASPFYIFMACFSGYGMLFEPESEFFMHLKVTLAGLSGLLAVALTLRRKIGGLYLSFIPVALLFLALKFSPEAFREGDVIPLTVIFAAPTAMLLSLFPSMRKLQAAGSGWGAGRNKLGVSGGDARQVVRLSKE